MIYLYAFLALYLIGPLRLLHLSMDYFKNKEIPSQQKALSILRTSRFVWISIMPIGLVLTLGMMFDGNRSLDGNNYLTIGLPLMIILTAAFLLPWYSLTNTGRLYRDNDYKKLILAANTPFIGLIFLILLVVILSI